MIEGRVRRALQAAQKYSLVANSVKSEILVEPEITIEERLASAAQADSQQPKTERKRT